MYGDAGWLSNCLRIRAGLNILPLSITLMPQMIDSIGVGSAWLGRRSVWLRRTTTCRVAYVEHTHTR
jgi:hypothetical protein